MLPPTSLFTQLHPEASASDVRRGLLEMACHNAVTGAGASNATLACSNMVLPASANGSSGGGSSGGSGSGGGSGTEAQQGGNGTAQGTAGTTEQSSGGGGGLSTGAVVAIAVASALGECPSMFTLIPKP